MEAALNWTPRCSSNSVSLVPQKFPTADCRGGFRLAQARSFVYRPAGSLRHHKALVGRERHVAGRHVPHCDSCLVKDIRLFNVHSYVVDMVYEDAVVLLVKHSSCTRYLLEGTAIRESFILMVWFGR